ncbi:MAG: serine/threonine-protein phosphatase [Gammaproteobacteria bacterium]
MSSNGYPIDSPGIKTVGAATIVANAETDDILAQPGATASAHIMAYSQKRPGKTSDNEDSLAVISLADNGCVLAVADGMGGVPCGDQASRLAVGHLGMALHDFEPGEGGYRDAILNGIDNAQQAICAMGVGSGTTLAIVEIQGGVLRTYNVGDSEILVTGQRGKIRFQSISHSPVGYALQSGMLDEHEAMHHDERHILSNFLGDAEMRIDIGPAIALARYDTVLVASDGLFDNLMAEEIVAIVRKGSLKKAAMELARLARERMTTDGGIHPSKPDDVSFVLYRSAS